MTTTAPPLPTSRLPASLPPATKRVTASAAIAVSGLSHAYAQRVALRELSLEVSAGELLAVLGPNGGGKSTLFRLLSTLLPIQRGSARILGFDVRTQAHSIRQHIGVVFQSPSLDRKLTVAENIRLQAALYGLAGRELALRLDELLEQFALRDRMSELTERLSGGLRRRVELAKGLIHQPRVLLLDEPSTGLDPAARSDLWHYLRKLKSDRGTTIVLTTHYLDEADDADRIAILNEGRLVALGPPDELRASVGGDSITLETLTPAELARDVTARFGLTARIVEDTVRLETPDGPNWIPRLMEAFPGQISAIRLGKPTLEDVFIARTGHRFWRERVEDGR
jgi:ABC-2 type transport system ATP-binding protein